VKEIAAGIQNGADSLILLRKSTQEKIIAALNYLPEDTDLLQAVFEWAKAKKSLDEKLHFGVLSGFIMCRFIEVF